MTFEICMLSLRLLFHIVTAASLALYMGKPHQQKYWVGFGAFLLAGTNAAMAVQILTTWNDLIAGSIQPWLVTQQAVLCGLVLKAHGNFANLLPHRWVSRGVTREIK